MRTNLFTAALLLTIPAASAAQRPAPPAVPGGDPAVYPPRQQLAQNAANTPQARLNYNTINPSHALISEEVFRSRSATRLMIFEERRYMRENTPTFEQLRQAALKERYEQAVNNAPPRAVWSGAALNDLAAVIRNAGSRGPAVPLDPEVAGRINWAGDSDTAGLGMVRGGSKGLAWPGLLDRERFATQRRQLGLLIDEAVNAVRDCSPSARKATDSALVKVEAIRDEVRGLCREPEIGDSYVEATGFLRRLGDAVGALRKPGAGKLLDRWVAKAATVDALLEQMTARGLWIAAASPGDEPHYTALYEAMSEYYRGMAGKTKLSVVGVAARGG